MNSVGNRIDVASIILLDGENISFDACLVLYKYIEQDTHIYMWR
jgi:hypothetical protein